MKSIQLLHYHKFSIVGWIVMLSLLTYILLKITALHF